MTHREEEEELVELALDKEVGEVTHGVGSQGSNVGELADLFSPQGRHPFYHIIGDLQQHTCY